MSDQFNIIELIDLATILVGLDIDLDYQDELIEERLMDEFNLDLPNFERLMRKLTPLMNLDVSSLTDQAYIGYGTKRMWLAKTEFKKFVSVVVNWMDGEKVLKEGTPVKRVVLKNGEPEFQLIILKADEEFTVKKKEVDDV